MEQKVAVVTAAGQGIGKACALELHARGYSIVLLSRSGTAEALAKKLGGVGMSGSVTEAQDLEKLFNLAVTTYDRVDCWVNSTGHSPNTGVPTRSSAYDPRVELNLLSLTDSDWLTAMEMILLNVVRSTRLIAPLMVEQGGGSIVNITSFAQKEPSYAYPTGSCMRMALAGYMKLFADSFGVKNIRMNNVLPGFIENFEYDDAMLSQVPIGRPGTLSEIAKTVAFLLSEDAGFITGQSILVDGGMNRGV
jgi:NAD(P)-dependent dehydrogenase (short-subunit alcohol dehydrogenase family)